MLRYCDELEFHVKHITALHYFVLFGVIKGCVTDCDQVLKRVVNNLLLH